MSSSAIKEEQFESTDFYELPFDEVVDLISDRKVYLHRGIAYVPHSELISVFVTHFRNNLTVEMNVNISVLCKILSKFLINLS